MQISYDDSNLRALCGQMTPQKRWMVYRNSMRRCGTKIKKVARQNLMATGVHNARQLARGLHSGLYRYKIHKTYLYAGFYVTTHKGKYASRQNQNTRKRSKHGSSRSEIPELPILRWIETGTDYRRVGRRGNKLNGPARFKVGAHKWFRARYDNRGRLKGFGFMAKTQAQTQDSVTAQIRSEVLESVKRLAQKYGCK